MSIETELLGFLEKNIQASATKVRNIEIIAYHYGFRDTAWPTLEETARQFKVKKQRIDQLLKKNFRMLVTAENIPSIHQLTELLVGRKYWLVAELESAIRDSKLAGEYLSIKGLFNLIEDLGIENEYDVYAPDLNRASRPSIASEVNNIVIHQSNVAQIRSLLKKAKKAPGRCGVANLRDLEDELGAYYGLMSELITNSESIWAKKSDDQFWYIFENRDNTLVNYSEKIFSVITECDSARLAHAYRNALDARKGKYPPESIIQDYLESSVYFRNDAGNLQFIGETSGLKNDIEKDVVAYLQQHADVRFPEFHDHLESIGYGRPHITKTISTSPLVFVDKSRGRGSYVYNLIGSAEPVARAPAADEQYKSHLARLRKLSQTGTDETVEQKTRKEQGILRDWLFKDKTQENCAICGHRYSVGALVTAHKKKRADCHDAERLDPYIVMPVCILGCDYLYENMFIFIEDGIVKRGRDVPHGADEIDLIDQLVGRKIDAQWLKGRKSYFQAPEQAA